MAGGGLAALVAPIRGRRASSSGADPTMGHRSVVHDRRPGDRIEMPVTPPANRLDDPNRLNRIDQIGFGDGAHGTSESLDRLTRLASRLLGAPVSLVSIVREDRQVFASQAGLSEPWATRGETPLTHSFCQHAVTSGEPLVIADARGEALVRENLAVPDLGVVAYAGVPLEVGGECVGSFCAIDSSPRAWSSEDLALLGDLAAAATTELELRWAVADRQAAYERMRDSERRFRALFEGMAEGVVLQREDGGIVSCNPAAERILGTTMDQMIGRTSLDPRWRSIREDGSPFPGDEHPAIVTLKTGRPLRDVIMGVRRADGSERWISIASQPLPATPGVDGGMVITTFTDVTERREGEMTAAADAAEKAALTRVATLAAGEASPSAVFAVAAEQAARALGGEVGEVVRYDEDRNPTVVGAWSRQGASLRGRGRMADPDAAGVVSNAAARALARRRTTSIWRRDPAPGGDADVAARCLEVASPVREGGRVWGAIAVASRGTGTLTRDSEVRIERFAELVGLAVAGARAREALESLAATDDLTGLANHRVFRARLDDEVARARRHDRSLSLIAIDLDHFKAVNDEYGHPVGDRVLAAVARRLGESVRESEVLARVGGEEFAWLLPETDAAGAQSAAERARASVARAPFPEVGRLTISAGVCELGEIGSAVELIRCADAALYAAKQGGRDRVSAYGQVVPVSR